MANQEYYLGICNHCRKMKALKVGICAECDNTLPEVFKEILKIKPDNI